MNIEHLKLFVRIAATNNISLAGKDLGLSPAVSSAHMNKLEETLGVRLLYRTTRKVSLTEDGIAFFPYVVNVLETSRRPLLLWVPEVFVLKENCVSPHLPRLGVYTFCQC